MPFAVIALINSPYYKWKTWQNAQMTRMHSSRMRTGRSLTVCRSLLPRWGWGGVSAPGRGGLLLGGVWSWGCLLPGGASGLGGVSAPGGCLLPGVGVSARGGVCSWGGLFLRGVCSWGVVSQHALRQTPPPPVNRVTHTCKNITLAQLRCGR